MMASSNGLKSAGLIFAVLLLVSLACQVFPTPPPLKASPGAPETADAPPTPQITSVIVTPSPGIIATRPSFSVDLPLFPTPVENFSGIKIVSWEERVYAGENDSLPIPLAQVTNHQVLAGLTNSQRAVLAENGFVVIHSQEAQFSELRDRVALQYGQPYYLTSDAAYHSLHLSFNELTKALEREELAPRLLVITQAAYDEVAAYQPDVQDTALQEDMELSLAYLGVALKLFDPSAELAPLVEARVNAQVEQIMAGRGRAKSILFPDFDDDYSAYKPVGHYAGDPLLENYFRGMTWFGRVHFGIVQRTPEEKVSRLPLIITLALRRVETRAGVTAAEEWARVDDVLTFLIGARDDYGPSEYAQIMDQVYGRRFSLLDLADDPNWLTFRRLVQDLPPPQINSSFLDSSEETERGWRFMGGRFSLDGLIMGNLVFDRVSTSENRRILPSGLDVMAAFGSSAAMQALEARGEMVYQNYPEQMAALKTNVETRTPDQWLGSAYNTWLYAFIAQVEEKGGSYPSYMRSPAWKYKDVNSALGSWAELKHDTTLYVKMPEALGGGGPPTSGPAPCAVEPNPSVFYRLSYVSGAIVEGLTQRNMVGGLEAAENSLQYGETSLQSLVSGMLDLADRLQRLGDIAVKELGGTSLDESDCALVEAPLGIVEQRVGRANLLGLDGRPDAPQMPPVPLVSAVAGGDDRLLEVGVGLVDRIYVAVVLGGEYQIAQGGVFTYYELERLRSERLDDEVWRQLLAADSPELPEWTSSYLLPGGAPVDVLAFRIGDTYRITKMGNQLNMRSSPSIGSSVVRELEAGDYVIIVDGPVQAGGFTWWKLKLALPSEDAPEGWSVENPEWYQRAWGQ